MSNRHTHIELPIAKKLVLTILQRGYTVGVNDGEETVLERCSNLDSVMAALASTDHDYVMVYDPDTGNRRGAYMLVWGNGAEVISDYTDNELLEELVKPADELAEAFSNA